VLWNTIGSHGTKETYLFERGKMGEDVKYNVIAITVIAITVIAICSSVDVFDTLEKNSYLRSKT
jgi:hypothetical protein